MRFILHVAILQQVSETIVLRLRRDRSTDLGGGANMKTKLILPAIAAFACAFAGSASAADMPLKAPPPAVAVFKWSGCYGGVNAGWIGGRTWADLKPTGNYLTAAGAAAPPNAAGTGALVGDQLLVTNGYRFDDSSWEGGVQFG